MKRIDIVERILNNPFRVSKRALSDPKSVIVELNRLYHQYKTGRMFDPSGMDIFTEDWDNCIILDACRYDLFRDKTPFEANITPRQSRGSATKQFVRGNFSNRDLADTVYVSANWWFWALANELNCDIHAAVKLPHDEGPTTHPKTVTNEAIETAQSYPNKRLLVHYMQPHEPYLGFENEFDVSLGGLRKTMNSSSTNRRRLIEAYSSNLTLVLEWVSDLVKKLDGKTVITSDHGELLGDRLSPIPVRWFGHPHSMYVDPLVTVPYQIIKDGPRRDITAGSVSDLPGSPAQEVSENLRDLGYLDS